MLTLAHPRPLSSFVALRALQIRKGKTRGDANVAEVEGIASTEHKDHEGQVLKQDGLDWRYFLREGWINYEHEDVKHPTRGTVAIIGEPIEVWPTTHEGLPATALRAHIFLDDPRGAQVIKTLETLQKASSARKIGFSIEGDALDVDDPRNPKVVKKAVIYNVTLTSNPVNPKARISSFKRAAIRKSLGLGDLGFPPASGERTQVDPLARLMLGHFREVVRTQAQRYGRNEWTDQVLRDEQTERLLLAELADRVEGAPHAVDPFDPFDPLASPYNFTHKGGIGYQTPSAPSGQSLSPLAPQSLEGAARKRRRPQSLAALLANIYNP